MHKLTTAALAIALGLAWSTLPAVAADTDKTVKDKAVDAKDTIKEKTSDAWDKTKEKSTEAKDKVKDTARNTKDKLAGKMESSADIRQAQQALKDKGQDPGPIDGIHGPRTSAALRSYQKTENIKVTGRLDSETRSHLMGQPSSSATTTPSASPTTVGSPSNPPQTPEKTQTK